MAARCIPILGAIMSSCKTPPQVPPSMNHKPAGPSTISCGRQSLKYPPNLPSRKRIMGGTIVNPHSWPWALDVIINFNLPTSYGCGGTLLQSGNNDKRSDMLLIAAHCVTNTELAYVSVVTFNPENIFIMAGVHDLTKEEKDTVQKAFGKDIRVIPGYVRIGQKIYRRDLALIRFDPPFQFTDAVRPICRPAKEDKIPSGKTCAVVGRGRSVRGSKDVDTVLRQLFVPVKKPKDCSKAWADYHQRQNVYNEADVICAGLADGQTGVCTGDCGGMLGCQRADGAWVLEGVTSSQADRCCTPGKPDIFARLSGSATEWIDANMNQMTKV